MLIGVTGKARAGKDTVAKIFQKRLMEVNGEDLPIYSFAAPLKDCVNDWLGWGEDHSDGALKEQRLPLKPNFNVLPLFIYEHFGSHISKEEAVAVSVVLQNLMYGDNQANIYEHKQDSDYFILVSPRQVYQWFGTEGMRQTVAQDFWTQIAPTSAIIADARFDNEADYIIENGGTVFKVVRDSCEQVQEHISEVGVCETKIERSILNNGSLLELEVATEIALDKTLAPF